MPVDETLAAEIESAVESQAVELEKTSTETISTTEEVKDEATEAVEEIVDEGTEEVKEVVEVVDEETEEKVEVKKEESKETKETGETGISDYVLQKAVLAGLSLDDARAFPNEDSLLRVVANVDAARQEVERAHQEGQKVLDAAKKEGPGGSRPDIFADLPKLDSENVEPEVVKTLDAFKNIFTKQQAELEEFKAQQQTSIDASQQAVVQEVEQWFDKEVESLGENFSEALGTGRRVGLTPGSSQFAKREEIAQQMAVNLAGYKAMGIQAPPREQVFDVAARAVLKDEYSQVGSKKIAAKLKKQAGQHISRSSGQTSKTSQSADEETAAMLDRKFSTGK